MALSRATFFVYGVKLISILLKNNDTIKIDLFLNDKGFEVGRIYKNHLKKKLNYLDKIIGLYGYNIYVFSNDRNFKIN